MSVHGVTRVNIEIRNNVYWDDAFQFGMPDDFTWSFTGKSFLLDVKAKSSDASALLALSSTGGTIIVDDVSHRRLHMYVTDASIRATLPIGCYVYDLVMVDNSTGERDALMYGTLSVVQGVTGED